MADTERQLKAILFSDVKSFSAMMGEDEERTVRLVKEHREIIRAILAKHRGEEHGTAGDSFFVLFASAVEAVQCAVEIQESFHRLNATRPPEEQIWIRIGIHIGDILVDRAENRVYGDGINIAARTEPLAEPGGICITRDVFQQVHRKLAVQAVCIGRKEMKNILDAPELYRLVVGQVSGPRRGSGRSPASVRGRGRTVRWVAAVSAAFLAVAGIAAFLVLRGGGAPAPQPVEAGTVTVLPFENLARSESLSWLGVGLSEGLADRLRGVRGLRIKNPPPPAVVAALSKELSGDALSLELARRVGARWVVSGTFLAAGPDVKATARVLLVDDGSVLKVVDRQGKADAALALQEELDRAVLEGLRAGIRSRERDLAARSATRSDAAYRAFARASEIFRRDGSPTPQNFRVLRELLAEAIAADPDYVAPHNLMASALLFVGGAAGDVALLRESLEHAEAAVRLAPGQAWPLTQRSRVRASLGMYTPAVEDFEAARKLDPDVYYEPGLYEAIDQLDHEERRLQDLVRLESANFWPWWSLGSFHVRHGRFEDARRPVAEAVRIHDESLAAGDDSLVKRAGWLEPVGAHALSGRLLLAQGDLEGAARAFQADLDGLAARDHTYKALLMAIDLGSLALIAGIRGDRQAEAGFRDALDRLVEKGGAVLRATVASELASYDRAVHLDAMRERVLVEARRAVEMTDRRNPMYLELLASALEKADRREEALAVNAEGKALLPECETFDRRAARLGAVGRP